MPTKEMQDLKRQIREYPPLQEWVAKVTAEFKRDEMWVPVLRTPTDVLGNRAMYALCFLAGEYLDGALADDELRADLSATILASTPVLWADDMMRVASEMTLPEHVIARDVMPYPLMWWAFEHLRGYSEEALISAMLLHDTPDGCGVLILGQYSGRATVPVISSFKIPYGGQWPTGDRYDPLIGIVLQMLAFMNSRFVESREVTLPRPDRRRIDRAGVSALVDSTRAVHVVKVRSPEPDGNSAGTSASEQRDWKSRWIVRGHYRAQWYPSITAHRVRWIAPYVKGPADKEIALPVVKVVR